MSSHIEDEPRTAILRTKGSHFIPGLREFAPNSEVKVFKLNPDGSKGELLRVEPEYIERKKGNGTI